MRSTTPFERQLDAMRHFPTLLRRWKGANARLAELTRSLRSLRIELSVAGRPGYLRIACVDPLFIHGPTEWKDADLEVQLQPTGEYLITDASVGLQVRAGNVEVSEHAGFP
jgi:hypothetical protein